MDDEPDIRLLVRLILTRAGYLVIEASGGAEAIDYLLGDAELDMALLDLRMPDVDGFAVLSALRANGLRDGLPILVVSAHADAVLIQRALDSGCCGYLSKPFHPGELVETVRNLVEP